MTTGKVQQKAQNNRIATLGGLLFCPPCAICSLVQNRDVELKVPHNPLIVNGCLIPRMAVVDIDSITSENSKNAQDKHSTFRSYCVSARLTWPFLSPLLKTSHAARLWVHGQDRMVDELRGRRGHDHLRGAPAFDGAGIWQICHCLSGIHGREGIR